MRGLLIAVALTLAVGAHAQQITAAECRTMEPTIASAALQLRRQIETYPVLARGMATVVGNATTQEPLGASATQVAIQTAHAMMAQERLLAALEDLQHQFRLCARQAPAR